MSLEATWDLSAPSQPRSFCVFTPPDDHVSNNYPAANSSNPFEAAAAHPSEQQPTAQAIVIGTERGSLHYRTYAPTTLGLKRGQQQSQQQSQQQYKPQPALGLNQNMPQLPRTYYPVDFSGLAGPVVAVIGVSTHLLLALVDDHRGTSAAHPGAFSAHWMTLSQGRFGVWQPTTNNSNVVFPLPRMSCAVYHRNCGIVYCAGRQLGQVAVPDTNTNNASSTSRTRIPRGSAVSSSHPVPPRIRYSHAALPPPGARSGPDAMAISSNGSVVVVAVGNTFCAVSGNRNHPVAQDGDDDNAKTTAGESGNTTTTKLVSFAQSSQVHPVLCLDVKDPSMLDPDWSCWFLASSRTCAVVDFYNAPPPRLTHSNARGETVTLASPILAAATSWPWLVVLTSDGLLSVRSPSCLAIALRTVEVGTRPNDYFSLRTLLVDAATTWIVAVSYANQAKVLQCQPDSAQDLADRFMRLAIDAMGANGFPRAAVAEAVHASFTATSYVGPEPTPHSRLLFKNYLEAILGLMDLESGATTSWPTQLLQQAASSAGGSSNSIAGEAAHHKGAFGEAHPGVNSSNHLRRSGQDNRLPPVVSAASPPSLLTGTALLCLACAYMQPAQASLANRAAKACVNQLGMIVTPQQLASDGAVQVCDSVAETLLQESIHNGSFALISGSSPKPIQASASKKGIPMEFVEAAVWLLRSCGKHDRAMRVLYERQKQQQQSQTAGGGWSQIKYDSYTATHLSELWGTGRDEGCQLVLRSEATHRLLEHNPRLGLSAFTALHPQNPAQWKDMSARDDPLAHPTYPRQVLQLLQSVQPVIPYGSSSASLKKPDDVDINSKSTMDDDDDRNPTVLPLESGRALTVTFLESALGIATGRPFEQDAFDSLPMEDDFVERMADFHDELAFLLLEGVIAERGDTVPVDSSSKNTDNDTPLGCIYRKKLRRLLRWPLCKVRADRFLSALPTSFLQERAFVLGNLGRHSEALTIFYRDLKRLDLALEYCDVRHEQIRAKREREKARRQQQGGGFFDDLVISEQEQRHYDPYDKNAANSTDCAYVPLVRVALECSETPQEGTTAAIQVLALRRSVMDWGAALRLLPKDVPVSAVARPFLIPALVESESQVRRLKVVSSLLRARYSSLKQQLTAAQLKAQENLHVVPQLKSLKLGDPLHSTKPFRARPSSSASPTFPDVMIIKHFFSRHLVIQAKVKHTLEGRSLGDVTFVVAESSEEAIQPSLQVPLKVLPYNVSGSSWCVLNASPQRMDSLAILTCELRYTVLDAEGSSGFGAVEAVSSGGGRTYVEELQDLEVYASHFTNS